ncbi:MAG TPA: ABC transporter permease [Chryseosolibacter sp.]
MYYNNNLREFVRDAKNSLSLTTIKLVILVTGFAAIVFAGSYIHAELSYDKHFSEPEQIYRVTMSSEVGGLDNHTPTSYPAIGPALKERFQDVKTFTRVFSYKFARFSPTFAYKDNVYVEDEVLFGDSTFFDVFNHEFASGSPSQALCHSGSVVITQTIEKKYFGSEAALGKQIIFNGTTPLEVTGVIKDPPANTHVKFGFLIPLSAVENWGPFKFPPELLDQWVVDWFWTYLRIDSKQGAKTIAESFPELLQHYIPEETKTNKIKLFLQPLADVHLYSSFDYGTDLAANGSISDVYFLILVCAIIFVITCSNFISINIFSVVKKHKLFGVHKVLGASGKTLGWKVFQHSLLFVGVALVLAMVLLFSVAPMLSNYLMLGFTWEMNGVTALIALTVAFAVAVIGSIYPSVYALTLPIAAIAKGTWSQGKQKASFRKVMIGVQLVASTFLVTATLVVFNQLQFLKNKDTGIAKDEILMLEVRGTAIPKQYQSFKNELLRHSCVLNVSSVSEPIGREVQFMSFKTEGNAEPRFFKILNVSSDFIETFGLELVAGRDFIPHNYSDSVGGFIINQAAAKALGWTEPVGKEFSHAALRKEQGSVIGVVKDFNFEPLHQVIDPLVIFIGSPAWYISVRLEKGTQLSKIADIEKTWTKFENSKPFSFHFLGQAIEKTYQKEQRLSRIFALISIMSVLMSCIGLFGLIAFVLEGQFKEIAIRKVLGDSELSIVQRFCREYVLITFAALTISIPLSLFVFNGWLDSFSYRIPMEWYFFAVSAVLISATLLITVLLRVIPASRINPAKILRE